MPQIAHSVARAERIGVSSSGWQPPYVPRCTICMGDSGGQVKCAACRANEERERRGSPIDLVGPLVRDPVQVLQPPEGSVESILPYDPLQSLGTAGDAAKTPGPLVDSGDYVPRCTICMGDSGG